MGWAIAQSPILGTTITISRLKKRGYTAMLELHLSLNPSRYEPSRQYRRDGVRGALRSILGGAVYSITGWRSIIPHISKVLLLVGTQSLMILLLLDLCGQNDCNFSLLYLLQVQLFFCSFCRLSHQVIQKNLLQLI